MIVNCIPHYRHAVLITKQGTFNHKLPDFEERLARLLHEKLQESFVLLRNEKHEEAASVYNRVLNTLWSTVAKPILDRLNDIGLRDDRTVGVGLPHLWWITTGWVNMLPIHAAGEHLTAQETGRSCTLMDHFISSYIPSLRAPSFA